MPVGNWRSIEVREVVYEHIVMNDGMVSITPDYPEEVRLADRQTFGFEPHSMRNIFAPTPVGWGSQHPHCVHAKLWIL